MKILIVEDNYVDQCIFEIFIKSYGNYDVVKNGHIAIKKFKEAYKKNNPYDLIFLDIIIPKINGYEVLLKIRNYEKTMNQLKPVMIVMISALDDLNNIKKSFKKQCNAYITKPVHPEIINKTIKDLGFIL